MPSVKVIIETRPGGHITLMACRATSSTWKVEAFVDPTQPDCDDACKAMDARFRDILAEVTEHGWAMGDWTLVIRRNLRGEGEDRDFRSELVLEDRDAFGRVSTHKMDVSHDRLKRYGRRVEEPTIGMWSHSGMSMRQLEHLAVIAEAAKEEMNGAKAWCQ